MEEGVTPEVLERHVWEIAEELGSERANAVASPCVAEREQEDQVLCRQGDLLQA